MNKPLVSIGMPVLHDPHAMERSIRSVLDQTEGNWELLLMEDGDTPRGEELLGPWLEKDHRIRWIRQPSRLGLTRLNNRLAQVADGRYFAWLTPGDAYRDDFFHQALAAFSDPVDESSEAPVVLCYPQAKFVHPVSGEESLYQNRFLLLDLSSIERLRTFFSIKHTGFAASGLMRTDTLRAVGGLPEDCAEPVWVLLTRLLLSGCFVQMKMPLLLTPRKPNVHVTPSLRHAGLERDLFGSRSRETLRLPTIRLVHHLLQSISHAPEMEGKARESLLREMNDLLLKKFGPLLRLELDRCIRLAQAARWQVRWSEDEKQGASGLIPSHHTSQLALDMEADLFLAQSLFPNHPGLWLARAVCAYFGGRVDEARWLCDQEQGYHPNNGDVKVWKERLDQPVLLNPLAWVG